MILSRENHIVNKPFFTATRVSIIHRSLLYNTPRSGKVASDMPASRAPSPHSPEELEKKLEAIAAKAAEDSARKRADQSQLPFSTLIGVPIDPEALALIPENTAREAGLIVLNQDGATLMCATTDPSSSSVARLKEKLEKDGHTVRMLVTTQHALDQALERYQDIVTTQLFTAGSVSVQKETLEGALKQITSLADVAGALHSKATTQAVELVLAAGLALHASDVHLEPQTKDVRLRFRIDGYLHDAATLARSDYQKVVDRIKVLSRLKLNIRTAPQDGRFTIVQGDAPIEVRVSLLPSEYGETLVLRLLDPRTISGDIDTLGMRPDLLEALTKALDRPNGCILTTGPTGSGKTTTLYASIRKLNTPDTKIITIEDPIEYHLAGVSQTQVDAPRGYTFASGLRSIVRQDPDIILVGEVRDNETADIAMNAALTGHLVLASLHTNDAAGTIPRLLELGVSPGIIGSALSVAIGQRLVRVLCPTCKVVQAPRLEDLLFLQEYLNPIREKFSLPSIDETLRTAMPPETNTCKECGGLGYRGRTGAYEIIPMSTTLEQRIAQSPTVSEVRELAQAEGMVSMTQDGCMKVVNQTTSVAEVRRVLS
ncbi:MAG: GspE/PulE family protein [Patescibacteria group bacterium]